MEPLHQERRGQAGDGAALSCQVGTEWLRPYASCVSTMLNGLNWRSLYDSRSDVRLFYKIVHHLVAIQMRPTPLKNVQTAAPLAFRHTHPRTAFYEYSFFSLTIVQLNRVTYLQALSAHFQLWVHSSWQLTRSVIVCTIKRKENTVF